MESQEEQEQVAAAGKAPAPAENLHADGALGDEGLSPKDGDEVLAPILSEKGRSVAGKLADLENGSEKSAGDEAKSEESSPGDEEQREISAEFLPESKNSSGNEKIHCSQSVVTSQEVVGVEKSQLEREMEVREVAAKNMPSASLDAEKDSAGDGGKKRGNEASSSPNEGARKKRGRKGIARPSLKKEEDDVCFVCFDGGDLVLCDQRSCPKAYHYGCIDRSAEFFDKKGPWHCAWHSCSGLNCSKNAGIHCQMCTKAYCASCSKQGNLLILEDKKGLCSDCAPLVKMIERNETVNESGATVDFNDKSTHEGLFKDYWEVLKAKKIVPVPEFDKEGKLIPVAADDDDDDEEYQSEEAPSSESEQLGTIEAADDEDVPFGLGKRKERKTKGLDSISDEIKCTINEEQKEEPPVMELDSKDEGEKEDDDEEDNEEEQEREEQGEPYKPKEFDGWASRELIRFLRAMNPESEMPMKRTAVTKLLWEYIKANQLQSPRKRTLIRCDEQLRTLFGKKTLAQRDVLKHLHCHFPSKNRLLELKEQQAGESQMDTGGDEKRGRLKRKLSAGPRADSNEFAAISPANIGLVYMRRALMEDMLGDPGFEQKVVGTFVRIRVPGMVSRNEMCYRLVQIVGTRVQAEEYKAGKKSTNIVLEVMNLHKKEDLTIDLVSNQDFTEEECKRLRQSIKCGFIKAPTVGDFEQKALAIREAKLNDWFETETARLSALRDRANEKGRKRELRECVEKLQKLSDPQYRLKELNKAPNFETDPTMDPEVAMPDEADPVEPQATTPEKDRRDEQQPFKRERRTEPPPPPPPPAYTKQESFGRRGDAYEKQESFGRRDTYEKQESFGRRDNYERGGWDNSDHDWRDDGVNGKQHYPPPATRQQYQEPRKEQPGFQMNMSPPPGPPPPPARPPLQVSIPPPPPPEVLEKEKAWYYQDPSGTVQGPFSFEQLRKWNTTGLFPADLKIWKTNQSQGVLLRDALARSPVWASAAGGGAPAPPQQQAQPQQGNFPDARGGGWDGGGVGGRNDWTPRSGGGGGGDWSSGGEWNPNGGGFSNNNNNDGGWGQSVAPLQQQQQQQQQKSPGWGGSSGNWGNNEGGGGGGGYRNNEGGGGYRNNDGGGGYRSSEGGGYRNSRSKKATPCKFYHKGYCRNGDACPFQHT